MCSVFVKNDRIGLVVGLIAWVEKTAGMLEAVLVYKSTARMAGK